MGKNEEEGSLEKGGEMRRWNMRRDRKVVGFWDGWMKGKREIGVGRHAAYLFFFVSLLTQILTSPGHFGSAHGVLFCREVFFRLRFWKMGLAILVSGVESEILLPIGNCRNVLDMS